MNWIDNLKRIMLSKKVNIEQLKDLIEQSGQKLSRNSISNILNGNNNPKVETVEMIASAMGLEVWELFSSSGSHGTTEMIIGFVEHQGTIYRIQSTEDLENLLALVKG